MAALSSAQYKKKTLRAVHIGVSDAVSTVANVAAQQTVTITGTPTGGTLPLTFGGQTVNVAYNATAAQVLAAFETLAGVGPGNVTVTGGPGPGTAWVFTFGGDLVGPVGAITSSAADLVGGSSPAVGIVQTTTGVLGEPAIAYVKTNAAGVQLTPETAQLVTQGTTQRYTDRDTVSYGAAIDQQVFEDALNQLAYTPTTSGLPAGTSKIYHGTGTMPGTQVELRLTYTSVKISDGSLLTEYLRFPKCSIEAYEPPANNPAETIVATQMLLRATKATTYVNGVAIPGVTGDGDFFTWQELL